jgi:transposase-like protein
MRFVTCPMCYGEAGVLGVLGYLRHYLCRNCGMQFSRKIKRRKKREKADATHREP